MSPRPVIFAEFNELCPWLIDQWADAGMLPNFARMRARSAVFETRADVDDPASLEPWIQWYSLHTGLSFAQHGVFHLTDGAKADHDDLWHAAHRAGRRVMNFASMNARPFAFEDSVFVADPWCEDGNAHPAALDAYNRFVGANVREYSNPDNPLTIADHARFAGFMATHGLRAATALAIGRQLVAERIGDRRMSWKRATLLDRLQFDVFRSYYRRLKPDFATFFINSTAHLQHSYWRQFQPDAFTIKPDPESMALYGDAIAFGYRAMDRLLGAFMTLADRHGALLVFMTALSQQPYLAAEERGGRHFHRLRDVDALFARLGLAHRDMEPTMTHQYRVRFDRDEDCKKALDSLRGFRLEDGTAMFDFNARTAEGLYFCCAIDRPVDASARVVAGDGRATTFGDLAYRIDATKSGRHHPSGALWFRTGQHRRTAQPVSILDILPTTLDLMDIAERLPGRTGRSLAGQLAI